MRYQVVLQFPGSSEDEFDQVIALEDELAARLGDIGDVDGHDFGSGEMNVFVLTDQPVAAFEKAKEVVETSDLFAGFRAAYRARTGGDYRILWPKNLKSFSVT